MRATQVIHADHATLERAHEGAQHGHSGDDDRDGQHDLREQLRAPQAVRDVCAVFDVTLQEGELDGGCGDGASLLLVEGKEGKRKGNEQDAQGKVERDFHFAPG